MKYIITGLHSSGKQEVVSYLEKQNIKCGKIFSNLDKESPYIYNSCNYETYLNEDINIIFENNSYLFFQEIEKENLNFNTNRIYEGLSKYTFDQNDVFILSPDQLLSIIPNSINEDICFIWLDNTKDNRMTRYKEEKRQYNYHDRESYELKDINSYVKSLYSFNSPIIYFNNEDPMRVATIIYTMIKHPDTFDMFVKNFN